MALLGLHLDNDRRWTEVKDYRQRKVDTVFGTVSFRSPRIISCDCEPPFFLATPFCPLLPIIPERATPELLALQAKLSRRCPTARLWARCGSFFLSVTSSTM
jgi:hypothetical protein